MIFLLYQGGEPSKNILPWLVVYRLFNTLCFLFHVEHLKGGNINVLGYK